MGSVGCWLGQITCITLYDIIALIITGLWLIAGTKFFISLYSRVNYSTHRPNQDTCDFGLYWFSLVLIFIVLCIVFGILWRFCKCFSSVISADPVGGKRCCDPERLKVCSENEMWLRKNRN